MGVLGTMCQETTETARVTAQVQEPNPPVPHCCPSQLQVREGKPSVKDSWWHPNRGERVSLAGGAHQQQWLSQSILWRNLDQLQRGADSCPPHSIRWSQLCACRRAQPQCQ